MPVHIANCEFTDAKNTLTPPPNGDVATIVSIQQGLSLGTYSGEFVAHGGERTRMAPFSMTFAPLPHADLDCGGTTLDVPYGGSAVRECRITSMAGYSADMQLECSHPPAGMACSAPRVSLPAGGSVTVAVRISVSAPIAPADAVTIWSPERNTDLEYIRINVIGAPTPTPPLPPGVTASPGPPPSPEPTPEPIPTMPG